MGLKEFNLFPSRVYSTTVRMLKQTSMQCQLYCNGTLGLTELLPILRAYRATEAYLR